MPEGVKAGVLGLTRRRYNAASELGRDQATVDDIRQRNDLADAIREHEAEIALRAGELPFLERIGHDPAEGDGAVTGLRLRLADLVVAIRALAHVQLTSLEIYILPSKPSKLGCAKAGERRRHQ